LVLPSWANPDTVYINTTLSSHHSYSSSSLWRWTWQRVPKCWQNLIWRQGNTQKKTYKYGIIDNGKEHIQSYIKDRYQRVLINNT
jgi:hypothetical protein